MFLLDPLTRPSTYWMEFWVDMTRWLKARAPTGAFDFFTYSELLWWFFFVSQPESSTQITLANLISVSPSTPSDGSGPSLCLQAWALDCHWKLWTRRRRSEMGLESQLITRRTLTSLASMVLVTCSTHHTRVILHKFLGLDAHFFLRWVCLLLGRKASWVSPCPADQFCPSTKYVSVSYHAIVHISVNHDRMESDCYALIVECLSGYIIFNVTFQKRRVVFVSDQVCSHDKHKMSAESSTKQTIQSNISVTRASGRLFILDGETEPTIALVGKTYSLPERDRVIPSTIRKCQLQNFLPSSMMSCSIVLHLVVAV